MPGENTTWPLPKFYFAVSGIPGNPVFQEITGLVSDTTVIEYRHGNGPNVLPIKMPGLSKIGNVTMKKGIFVAGDQVWTWFNTIKMNTIARSTILVDLLDQTGNASMRWTLNNAFPVKITGTDLKSDGSEVAVESIEIAYETLVTQVLS